MKALVVYSTKTKNTLKLAEALYDTIRYRKELKSITDKPDPEDYGFIAVGFPIKDGKPDPATMEFLPKIRDKEVFLFATHASARDSDLVKNAMKIARELAGKARIIGTFSCQGEVSAEMIEKAAAQSPQPPWLADAPSAKGHPDEKDIAELVHFFNEMTI
ncbi:MAG: flavodoxin family protein [Deltaproteobacteria bacterium]|nr:flavodoxin family protein [Deltaproteobacteria bacterium]MDL1961545.1 flavodoxin family protein [Deltaproteobacteria bacterium]